MIISLYCQNLMKFNRKLLLTTFSLLLVITLIWDIYLYSFSEKTTIWHFLYNAAYGCLYLIGGVIAIYYSFIFSIRSNLGKLLFFFGAGLLSYEIALLIWVYYNLALKVAVPFPSWADAGFMIFYPLIFLGTYYLVKIYKTLINFALLRDSIIISLLSLILVFGINRPDISTQLPPLQIFINFYYPMGDFITLSLALIALRIGGGKLHPSLYIFCIGMLLQAVADIFFTYRTAQEIYWNGDISDLLFTFSAYFMSIGLFEIINNLSKVSITENSTAVVPPTTPIVAQNPPGGETHNEQL